MKKGLHFLFVILGVLTLIAGDSFSQATAQIIPDAEMPSSPQSDSKPEEKIDDLQSRQKELEARVDNLQDENKNLRDKVDDLEDRVNDLELRVER
ncbi:MAG: hypothetical protein HY586_06125 [Candidatus Omnitrophica bacterium]|nr:hypothetical protein [Candidatus Omnitrophota bacterium]